jgi:dihydroorotase
MNDGMKDMTNMMSKFLNLGMTLPDIIDRTTWKPANVIQRPELGHLSIGADADVAVFSVQKGEFGFIDSRRRKITGNQKINAELTIRAGRVVWDLNGTAVPMYNVEPLQY